MGRYIAQGADGVEVDVQLSAGRPVIGHPPRRGRVPLLRERIARIIESLHLTPGIKPERIAELLPRGSILWLDIKGRDAPRILRLLGEPLRRWRPLVVSTRYHDEVPSIVSAAPGVLVMLSLQSRPPRLKALLSGLPAGGIAIESTYIDEDLVTEAKSLGVAIAAWVVNDEDEMVRLMEIGVDFLITDYPGVAKRLCARIVGSK